MVGILSLDFLILFCLMHMSADLGSTKLMGVIEPVSLVGEVVSGTNQFDWLIGCMM